MNITELKAHSWLTSQGYKDIKFQGLKNPDFITSDGKFEVKKNRNGTIVFSRRQFEDLKNQLDTLVLVFNDSMKPQETIPFEEIMHEPKSWHGIRIYIWGIPKLSPKEQHFEPVYTTKEVANLLRVSLITVRHYINTEQLQALRAGGVIRIAQSQLDEFRKHLA